MEFLLVILCAGEPFQAIHADLRRQESYPRHMLVWARPVGERLPLARLPFGRPRLYHADTAKGVESLPMSAAVQAPRKGDSLQDKQTLRARAP